MTQHDLIEILNHWEQLAFQKTNEVKRLSERLDTVNYEWFYGLRKNYRESKLNGRLMAKSPEMLNLLVSARCAFEDMIAGRSLKEPIEDILDNIYKLEESINASALPVRRLKK